MKIVCKEECSGVKVGMELTLNEETGSFSASAEVFNEMYQGQEIATAGQHMIMVQKRLEQLYKNWTLFHYFDKVDENSPIDKLLAR